MSAPVGQVLCRQPGCPGTVVDGYCDVCGAPPSSTVPGPSAPGAQVAGAQVPSAQVAGAQVAGARDAGAAPQVAAPAAELGSQRTASSHRLASAPLGSARAVVGSRATRRTGTRRNRAARLGAGITTVPPAPLRDPATAVLDDPQVPEERRTCPACGAPVGRSRDGRPGRTEGFCPNCRAPFSFSPKLRAGDTVAGQYEVTGCLAHGGLGWIYLARDRNVSDRWVVLKGLLNAGDQDALAVAIAERRFLAQVEHPLIVEIYNFVEHEGAGYIVMEYVGGRSLKELLRDRMTAAGGMPDPVPVDQALAYLIEVLPALQYLHDLGLLYCDLKPDNVIQIEDAIKLIDLGGVRRIDDLESPIYGTLGYQAPEVPELGPSVASDVYTVGRTLVSLAIDFRGNTSTYATRLPDAADVELFRRHDSLYRLVARACAHDPADRFPSVEDLRVQMLGVLREVVAAGGAGDRAGTHSTPSALFEPPLVTGDTLDWRQLPGLRVDDADPQASWLASLAAVAPQQRLELLLEQHTPTVETRLATAWTAIALGDHGLGDAVVGELLAADPWEWRAVWLSGLSFLAQDDARSAQAAFNAVYGQVPGELAPKLALALACELGAEPDVAEQLYLTCLRTDANYVAPAAFGLARVRAARIDAEPAAAGPHLGAAITALDLVPPTSSSFAAARVRRADLLVRHGGDLAALGRALDGLGVRGLDPRERAELRAAVLAAALGAVESGGARPDVLLDGVPAEPGPLRDALEHAYRDLAARTDRRDDRVRLVERANLVRRWSWT